MVDLANKPSEVLFLIFEALWTFQDVLSLAGTCHRLRTLYSSKADSIMENVLSRTILCYGQASKLAKAQESAAMAIDPYPEAETPALYTYLRRITSNAKEVRWAARRFEAFYMPMKLACSSPKCCDQSLHLQPHEEMRFTFAFYFIRRCVLSHFSSSIRTTCENDIAEMDVETLIVACHVVDWLTENMEYSDQEKLGIPDPDPPDELIGVESNIAVPEWREAWQMLNGEYHNRLTKEGWGPDYYDGLVDQRCSCCGGQAVFENFRKQPCIYD
jgi:hypothetical protein